MGGRYSRLSPKRQFNSLEFLDPEQHRCSGKSMNRQSHPKRAVEPSLFRIKNLQKELLRLFPIFELLLEGANHDLAKRIQICV